MKTKQKLNNQEKTIAEVITIYRQDLRAEFYFDSVALSVMECLEERVSEPLLMQLKRMLIGYDYEMQLEIADDVLDFVCYRMVHTTGCPSADFTLKLCYMWIADELGYDKEDIKKTFTIL